MSKLPLLPTTVIGSYPRPKWLRESIRLHKAGKISDEDLQEAFNDAVIAVLKDHYNAGVDVPTDGEVRRDEMVEFFAERIKGFKFYGPVRVWGTAYYRKPSVVSKIEYKKPMLVDEFTFAKSVSYTDNLKITITGPYTIAEWSYNEYYKNKKDLVFDLAKAINQEIKNLVEAGAKIIQIDEPALHTRREDVSWGVEAVNEAVKGVNAKLVMHICYGEYSFVAPYLNELKVDQINFAFKIYNYKPLELLKRYGFDKELGAGVIDVHNRRIETSEEVANDIRKILEYFTPEKVWINPDCGLKLLSRKIAYQKLVSMVEGTKVVREELKRKGYSVD
ncbi:methionine synthase [Saccharolobus islandicus]|jgi:Methionine synthase II (cobalamin-independent)|uniref:Methionine synthase n=5 Tax=Saccharolobus islandicus TaxID=43080 RepID=METE_SACI2|nr:methionine synthase [Sulfolobus islandicus]C3MR07.1 RecName: Full=Methionine synthase; AltName: Full=Homocysteine methyltransferase [Sulfolobus islandicus L.S.2.15]C3MWZ5.1 RecName: Full=Methionine synthase; AltName: Full=Homocysteine methyltransferase [Sulfolobus islandicus M.14.25]C3MZ55.1 RecName: Full=Methionine synthase; AltName: Full=Homocysteine methyltransferase [Sulfolobus islandicus M.16.27]C4KID3.1 RecName: Full=Methionine synthase; AltName: Full=Homocysteine methyltransferase [Su